MSDIDKIHANASTANASTATKVSRIGSERKERKEGTESKEGSGRDENRESIESTEGIPQPKYINQGTYGCIYQPMIPCANQHATTSSIHYISKISKKTESEERIGHLIRQIPQYQYYFAPIIDSCPVNLNQINEREIKKCDIVDIAKQLSPPQETKVEGAIRDNSPSKPAVEYKSYKIRYVGKYHVGKYIQRLAECAEGYKERKPSNQDQLKQCVELHIHLLKALKKLGDAGIVHYDLKSNNIILDDRYHRPVVIDFGISFETSDLDTFDYTKYKNIFYSDYNVYPPWCIEIVLLSYIILNVPALYDVTDPELIPGVFDRIITETEMAHIEDTYARFLEDNHMYTSTESYMKGRSAASRRIPQHIPKDDVGVRRNMDVVPTHISLALQRNMKTPGPASGPETTTGTNLEETWNQTKKEKMKEILLPYQGKNWKELIQKLTANVQSWDNYSLAVIMKELVSYLPTDISSVMHEYIDMLVQIIVSEPDTRPTAETTLRTIIEWVRGLQGT